MWSNSGADAVSFRDPEWAKGKKLLRSFEAALAGMDMKECLNKIAKECQPMCDAGFRDSRNVAIHLNKTWCKETNEKMLQPAGFSCKALYWVGDGFSNLGDRHEGGQEHLAMAIMKYVPDSTSM